MGQWKENRDSVWQKVQCPGLSSFARDVFRLGRSIPQRLEAYEYKQKAGLLWLMLIGGTGTGKSTIFNALCGDTLSQAGIERPKTSGPILFAHENAPIEDGFPLEDIRIERISRGTLLHQSMTGTLGGEGLVVFVEHAENSFAHLVLADTPDLDSLEVKNRWIVEELMHLSDVVLFVTSQEKYADEVPFRYFRKYYAEGKTCFLVLNKAQPEFDWNEAANAFQNEGISIGKDQVFLLPYLTKDPGHRLRDAPQFAFFYDKLIKLLSGRKLHGLLDEVRKRDREAIKAEMLRLQEALQAEKEASHQWNERLHAFFQAACVRLVQQQQQQDRMSLESRQYIHRQIRKHFSRYDILRKPRRFIADTVRAPLMFLGLVGKRHEESHEEALARIRDQIDLSPLEAAIESFNREVLEKLSPEEPTSPLFKDLRRKELVLTRDEIRELVHKEQDKLVAWLEETFHKMAEGIPKSKQVGIHSVYIVWGAIIITLETMVMGGITILEAVLNSALAPFLTKGAVELFVHQELKKVARELKQRYHEGLVSVISHQRMRYEECVRSLLVDEETMKEMERALTHLDA